MKQISTVNDTRVKSRASLMQMLAGQEEERLDLIEQQFEDGFELLGNHHHIVTVFGSARFEETEPHYQKARDLGAMLANEGFTVLTGGGGGIMEAANRGAFEAGGQSIGLNITLPHEQRLNPYLTESLAFHHFFAVGTRYGNHAHAVGWKAKACLQAVNSPFAVGFFGKFNAFCWQNFARQLLRIHNT